MSADADSGPGPVPLDPTDEHVEAAGGSLSAIQQQALLLSSQGKPDTVVGPMCGFSPKWVQRLRKRPEAVEFLRAVNAEVINEVEGGIRMGMIESVTAAREVLAGNNDSARMRAVTFFGGAFESICASSEQAAVVDGLRREIADLRAQVAELIDEQEDQ